MNMITEIELLRLAMDICKSNLMIENLKDIFSARDELKKHILGNLDNNKISLPKQGGNDGPRKGVFVDGKRVLDRIDLSRADLLNAEAAMKDAYNCLKIDQNKRAAKFVLNEIILPLLGVKDEFKG